MKLFRRNRSDAELDREEPSLEGAIGPDDHADLRQQREGERPPSVENASIEGERGIPSVNRARSKQSRLTAVLAIALMGALGIGLLGWYYKQMLARPVQSRQSAQAAVQRRSQSEMPLPALGRIERPRVEPVIESDPSVIEQLLGPEPPVMPEAGSAIRPAKICWSESLL